MNAPNPLKTAIEQGDVSTINELLDGDPELTNREFHWTDRKGRRRSITPIRYANACDRQESIDALLAAGATLDFLNHSLWQGVANRNMAQVKRLLARGVRPDPGLRGALGNVGPWRYEFVNLLIAAGADFEDGACMDIHRGDLSAFERRIRQDPSLITQIYEDSSHAMPTSGTLLHVAAAHNDAAFIDLLIGYGADINAAGPIHETNHGRRTEVIYDGTGGQTPIFHTIGRAFGCCYEAFDHLLQNGPDLSVRAKCHVEGEIRAVTPLGYARARQQWCAEADGTLGREQRLVYREIDRLLELGAPE